ncbi:MAG: large conductance mechanosensitive channel protein MscL [Clostridiales bacterium]|nr:large conductance mechanosensitive channel protein MscL [Clostridiales bacterium]
MWKQFKEFALKGNVVDLAVAVVIGGAFGRIVTSLVNDIIMPLLGALVRVDFSHMFWILKKGLSGSAYITAADATADGAVVLTYGDFLSSVLDFFIIALSIFLVIKLLSKVKKGLHLELEETPPTPPRLCVYCYTEIHADATRCPHCTSEL